MPRDDGTPSPCPRPLPGGEGNKVDLADKTFDWNEALCYRIYSEEEAFQSHSSEQRRPAWSDEAGCRDLLTVKVQLYFRHRPDLELPSSDHDWLLASWDNAQAVCKIPRNHEQGGAAVNKQLYLLAAAGGPG